MRRAVLLGLALTACSHVSYRFERAPLGTHDSAAIKHACVLAWAPPELEGMADTLGPVTADLIKLRRNYLVHHVANAGLAWPQECQSHEGVFLARVLRAEPGDEELNVRVALELYRATNGALEWRAEAEGRASPSDGDLVEMTASYAERVGPHAARYAAPLFVLMQDLVAELPNPQLTDDELMEKLELD